MAATEPCWQCVWYDPDLQEPTEHGLCRRNPPYSVPYATSASNSLAAFWPTVKPGDWCGEWKIAPVVEKDAAEGRRARRK